MVSWEALYEEGRETYQIGDAAMALKLIASKLARLGAGATVFDALGSAKNGAVESEGFRALEELWYQKDD
jgi:hypothetical protein